MKLTQLTGDNFNRVKIGDILLYKVQVKTYTRPGLFFLDVISTTETELLTTSKDLKQRITINRDTPELNNIYKLEL